MIKQAKNDCLHSIKLTVNVWLLTCQPHLCELNDDDINTRQTRMLITARARIGVNKKGVKTDKLTDFFFFICVFMLQVSI